jgi:hypothetical protein
LFALRPTLKTGETASMSNTNILEALETFGYEKGMELLYSFGKLFQKEELPLKKLIRTGNSKLPRTTAIFNMSSATDCASLKLGKCKAVKLNPETGKMETVCYALKSEKGYRPSVLPFRRRQDSYWREITAERFAIQFIIINSLKKKKYDKIRLNEAGDFHDQACVDKAEAIAKILLKYGIQVYCYTSRDDLDYSKVKHLVINGSGFKLPGIANEFKMIPADTPVKEWPKGYAKCPADCTVCDRCSIRGKNTFVYEH